MLVSGWLTIMSYDEHNAGWVSSLGRILRSRLDLEFLSLCLAPVTPLLLFRLHVMLLQFSIHPVVSHVQGTVRRELQASCSLLNIQYEVLLLFLHNWDRVQMDHCVQGIMSRNINKQLISDHFL